MSEGDYYDSQTDFQKERNDHFIPHLQKAEFPFTVKPHVSTWFITLNSNESAKTTFNKEKISDKLVFILKELFVNLNKLRKFLVIRYEPYSSENFTVENLKNKVIFPDINGIPKSNKVLKYNTEVGKKYHRVHLHALYRIIHYTFLKIDLKKLQEETDRINTKYGLFEHKVYINVKFVKSTLPLANYMTKDIGDGIANDLFVHSNPEKYEEEFEELLQSMSKIKI